MSSSGRPNRPPLKRLGKPRPVGHAVWVGSIAGLGGLATWMVTMGSAPRYSYGVHQAMGNAALVPVLIILALVGGYVVRHPAGLVGFMPGLPGLLLSPWTAPRGDDDGLWLLIIPTLAGLLPVLVFGAKIGARVADRRRPTRNRRGGP